MTAETRKNKRFSLKTARWPNLTVDYVQYIAQ
jgi:hypothetical protein